MKVYDLLKGGFLVNEHAIKNWRFIIFVVFLLLFMIRSSHRADSKVMEIAVKLRGQEVESTIYRFWNKINSMKMSLL